MKCEPEAWRRAYREDGYLVVEDLLDPRELSRLREATDRITRDPSALPPNLKAKLFFEREHVRNNPQRVTDLTPEECGEAVRQVEDLPLFDPAFAEFICYPPMLDVLEALFESTEFSFASMFGRPKAARVGNGILNLHRDAPSEGFTSADTLTSILCLDAMTPENGATVFYRGSHRVSDEEAVQERWLDVPQEELNPADRVEVRCRAGACLFFSTKTIHAAGHNRSASPRRTVITSWAGPGVLAFKPQRFAYHGLMPRSTQPARRKQLTMAFPQLFAARATTTE